MEFKSWLENFEKYQNFLETKQSQYGRYFQRGADDSSLFASEHIPLRPTEGKQKTNETKKNLRK